MRQYSSPAGFRAAVDARLRDLARRLGVDALFLRRQAALERLMARLMKVAPGRWAIKGGLALEIRLGARARPTVDLDTDHVQGAAAAREDLQRAIVEDLRDHFAFSIAGIEDLREGDVRLAVRYNIICSVATPTFESLQVDVTVAPPDPWDAEPAWSPGLLADIGLGPVEVLVIPLERQIAEKLRAYTRQYDGGTTRAKDLVDFILIRRSERVDAGRLKDAIHRTFARRGTHAVPDHLSAPKRDLTVAYSREARAVGITTSLEEAHKMIAEWLDPVLACTAKGTWNPHEGRWIE